MSQTTISSFVVRFTQEWDEDGRPAGVGWRGVIRHIQSNEQARFIHVQEAVRFMANFVDLGAVELVDSQDHG